MIGKQPKGYFVEMIGQGAHFDMDRVVAHGLVPRPGQHQDLSRLLHALPGFINLDTGWRSHQVAAGLLAEPRVTEQAARYEPAIYSTARASLGSGRRYISIETDRRRKGRESCQESQRSNYNSKRRDTHFNAADFAK